MPDCLSDVAPARESCRNTATCAGVFVCSRCGARTQARVIPAGAAQDAAVRKLCAHLRIDPMTVAGDEPQGDPIAYCPACGAKVVG